MAKAPINTQVEFYRNEILKLIKSAKRMRMAQIEYIKFRGTSFLYKMKNRQREFDQEIKELEKQLLSPQQNLFDA